MVTSGELLGCRSLSYLSLRGSCIGPLVLYNYFGHCRIGLWYPRTFTRTCDLSGLGSAFQSCRGYCPTSDAYHFSIQFNHLVDTCGIRTPLPPCKGGVLPLHYTAHTTGCNFLRTRTGYTLLRRDPYTVEVPVLWPSRNPHLHGGRVILFGIGLANDIK